MKFNDIDWQTSLKDWSFYDLTQLLAIVERYRNEKMCQITKRTRL